MIAEWIEQAALRRGDAVYLEDARGRRTLTYTQLRTRTADWAAYLDSEGVPAGAKVGIRLPEPLDYAEALIAVIASGRIAVPLDPGAPEPDLRRILKITRPRLTLTTPAPAEAGRSGALVASRGGTGAAEAPVSRGGLGGIVPPGQNGIFLSTSGTTGTPKGILLTETQLAHVAACVVAHHRLTAKDRGYCSLPLFHVNAEVVGVLATLAAQARLAIDRRFSRQGFWDVIRQRKITWINAVPAIITLLASEEPPDQQCSPDGVSPTNQPRPTARPAPTDLPNVVRFIRSASAPLPAVVLRRFEETAGIPVVETYGMTEAASMITANPIEGPRKAGSAGRPAGTEVRVMPEGQPGTIGRVQIRGRGVITRYAEGGKPDAITADGWLDTGDLGYLDEDGYLFLAGRSDDVINRGGEKIYPREIEEILLAQPGVQSAVVVGSPDEVLGSRPVAYVTGEPGIEDSLRVACEARLPKYKRPGAYYFVDEMPIGPTGKVQRRRLAELAATAK
jgi:oxalate---CoA ligase